MQSACSTLAAIVEGPHYLQKIVIWRKYWLRSKTVSILRLYKFLGLVTKKTLYFEGNANTDIEAVQAGLRKHGFAHIELLGMCDDDPLPKNNCRSVLRASK